MILLAVAFFIAGGIWLAARPVPNQIEGMVDTNEIQVAARTNGRLETLMVREGDQVARGQILFVLTNRELEAQRAATQASLSGAQAVQEKVINGAQAEDIAATRSSWLAQKAVAEQAAVTAKRMNNLFAEGVVSAQKRDEANAHARASVAGEAAARAQYEKSVNGARIEDKKAVNAQVSQAAEAYKGVVSLEEELQARAPVSGQITKRFANEGEVIPPGFPVFSMIRLDDFWVSFNLREDNFSGLIMGQELVGSLPALNLQGVKFKVYFINPQGNFATWRATRLSDGYDVKAFEVRVRPVEPVPQLRPGMTVLFDWPQR